MSLHHTTANGTADVKSATAELRLAFGALTKLYQSMTVAL